MYKLIVKGARRATLAYHSCETAADLRDLIAVYTALGYAPEALIIDDKHEEKAA